MARVLGIGGIFFKSADPQKLNGWYEQHLGFKLEQGAVTFPWNVADGEAYTTVWAPFPQDTKYFAPSVAPYMINYIVDDLDGMLRQLRAAGVAVDEKTEEHEYGRFGWAMDPEGNRFELWEPVRPRA